MNVSKTKELIMIKGQTVEIMTDKKKNILKENTNLIFKMCSQCLYLGTVYRSLVESILSFNIIMWSGNLNIQRRNKLQRIVNMASKIIGKPQRQLNTYEEHVKNKTKKIISDHSHPLHCESELLPSGRCFKLQTANRNIYLDF